MSTNPVQTVVTSLEPALRQILGDALIPGDAAHIVDGLVPRFVATPASVEELATALAAASTGSAAVVPWGGGHHMSLGNLPARYDIALRTTKLDRVIEYEPADLTVTVEAGITLGRLQALLAEHGQFLPIDPPGGRAGAPADATIGGVLAANLSGPSRHAYGLPRDWLIGCRVAHADGSVSKGGGRVVKNVAGYDMPKLYVGSLGTLGVIVEATFKVAPLPAAQETWLAAFPSLETAAEAVFAADERGLAFRAAALADARGAATLPECPPVPPNGALAACWLAGPAAAVERTARELAALAGGAEMRRLEREASEGWWAKLNDNASSSESAVSVRASLPPSEAVGFMRRLAALRDTGITVASIAYPTTGLVLARLGHAAVDDLVSAIEQARRAAAAGGGSLVVTAAPVAVKERIDVWGDPSTGSGQSAGGAFDLMRRLKEQFDPRGTLNPGRFVGGL